MQSQSCSKCDLCTDLIYHCWSLFWTFGMLVSNFLWPSFICSQVLHELHCWCTKRPYVRRKGSFLDNPNCSKLWSPFVCLVQSQRDFQGAFQSAGLLLCCVKGLLAEEWYRLWWEDVRLWSSALVLSEHPCSVQYAACMLVAPWSMCSIFGSLSFLLQYYAKLIKM